MKIAHLQFAPIYGEVHDSIARADELLEKAQPGDFDILLLPEMAFMGYNFVSLSAIAPFLEHRGLGLSSRWARAAAKRYHSLVGIGYPETTAESFTSESGKLAIELKLESNYNACTVFGPDGEQVAHYRKSFLYTVDEYWCIEGQDGFYAGEFPAPVSSSVAMGICMDINPYQSTAPWEKKEFGHHALESGASLVIVTMAWNSLELSPEDVLTMPSKAVPEDATLAFWISRLTPLIQADRQTILVMGNRSGVEGDVIFSGSSMIARVGHGSVEVWDVAGKGEDRLLVVDTDTKPSLRWDYEARKLVPNTE